MCVCVQDEMSQVLPSTETVCLTLLGNESHDGSKGRQSTTLLPPWMLSFVIAVFQAFASRHLCERNVQGMVDLTGAFCISK